MESAILLTGPTTLTSWRPALERELKESLPASESLQEAEGLLKVFNNDFEHRFFLLRSKEGVVSGNGFIARPIEANSTEAIDGS